MSIDTKQIGELMHATVPWVKTTGIEFVEATAARIVVELPDAAEYHNHVGGPHAAVMFGTAETASGALMLTAFADLLSKATPLVARSEIGYTKLALGRLRAEAVLGRDAAEVAAELESGTRPEIPVAVTISNAAGETTGHAEIHWTLKPNR